MRGRQSNIALGSEVWGECGEQGRGGGSRLREVVRGCLFNLISENIIIPSVPDYPPPSIKVRIHPNTVQAFSTHAHK
jgi:hypothetical protein